MGRHHVVRGVWLKETNKGLINPIERDHGVLKSQAGDLMERIRRLDTRTVKGMTEVPYEVNVLMLQRNEVMTSSCASADFVCSRGKQPSR